MVMRIFLATLVSALIAVVSTTAAEASIDPRLVGHWLAKTSLNPPWYFWRFTSDGKGTDKCIIFQEDLNTMWTTNGFILRRADDVNHTGDSIFVPINADELLVCDGGSIALWLRIPEGRWNKLHAINRVQEAPEYSDARYAALNDQDKLFAQMSNFDPNMKGNWVSVGEDRQHELWTFGEKGDVHRRSFDDRNNGYHGWVFLRGDSMLFITTNRPVTPREFKYERIGPDEMTILLNGHRTVLLHISNERAEELLNMNTIVGLPNAPEIKKLNSELERLGQTVPSSSTSNP